jgi:hypothetical protein
MLPAEEGSAMFEKPKRTPDVVMSEMLAAYQQHFFESAKSAPNRSAQEAKEIIDRARKVIKDSRIGKSACELFEHVKYWPAWSKRPDFEKNLSFPVEDVSGNVDRGTEDKPLNSTTVQFSYSSIPFRLVCNDKGNSHYGDDMGRYGKLEVFAAGELVLGIDIAAGWTADIGYDSWHFSDVFAFAPGQWMKAVAEMAALIQAYQIKQRDSYADKQAIERAKNIRF